MSVHVPEPPVAADVFARACRSRAAFESVTGKWPSLVLLALWEGPHRFGELRRHVDGVSEKMLAQTLRSLVDSGWVRRADADGKVAYADYALTDAGENVARRLRDLADLLEEQINAS